VSHIDSFRHEIVGYFGWIAVYHPLEPINGDFACTPEQLVLGGGSGEHPALVFESPTACVARFLHDRLTRALDAPPRHDPLHPVAEVWMEAVAPHADASPNALLTYYEWERHTHEAFREKATREGLPHSLRPDEDLEDWLIRGIGAFVFFAMPGLAPAILSRLDAPYSYGIDPEPNNIRLILPNAPVFANGGNAFTTHWRRAPNPS
jgi:hypothetical protein